MTHLSAPISLYQNDGITKHFSMKMFKTFDRTNRLVVLKLVGLQGPGARIQCSLFIRLRWPSIESRFGAHGHLQSAEDKTL